MTTRTIGPHLVCDDDKWRIHARHQSQLELWKLLHALGVPDHDLMLSYLALVGAEFSEWRSQALVSQTPRTIFEAVHAGREFMRTILNESNLTFAHDHNARAWMAGYYLKNSWYRLDELHRALREATGVVLSRRARRRIAGFVQLNPCDLALDRSQTRVWEVLHAKQQELRKRWMLCASATTVAPRLNDGLMASSRAARRVDPIRDDRWKAEHRTPISFTVHALAHHFPAITKHRDLMSLYLALVGAAYSLWKAVYLLESAPRTVEEAFDDAKGVIVKVIHQNWIPQSAETQGRSWTSGYYLRNAWYRLAETGRELSGTNKFRELDPRTLAVDRSAMNVWSVLHYALNELVVRLRIALDAREAMFLSHSTMRYGLET